MKRLLIVALGTAALLGLALIARPSSRVPEGRRPAESESAPATIPSPVAVDSATIAPPAPPEASRPGRMRWDRISSLLARQRVLLEQHRGAPYTEEDLAQVIALEREIGLEAEALAREIRENPQRGHEVLDLILGLDDGPQARRLAGMLSRSFGDAVRSRLARLLQGGASVREREIACLVLGVGQDPAGLAALLDAAQADPDPALRRAALDALSDRLRGPASEGDATLILQFASRRSSDDPDASVRARAAGLVSGRAAELTGRSKLAR